MQHSCQPASRCHEFRLHTVFFYCLLQAPRWWQWQRSMPTTPPRITPCCATTSSDSRRTSRPQTCSTSTQRKATLSLSSRPRCWTERWVSLANVCVFISRLKWYTYSMECRVRVCVSMKACEQAQKPGQHHTTAPSLSNRSETTGWLLFQQGDEYQNIDWAHWWKRNISCCQTLSA